MARFAGQENPGFCLSDRGQILINFENFRQILEFSLFVSRTRNTFSILREHWVTIALFLTKPLNPLNFKLPQDSFSSQSLSNAVYSSTTSFIKYKHTWLLVDLSVVANYMSNEIVIYKHIAPNGWKEGEKKNVSKLNIGSTKKFIVWTAIVFSLLFFFLQHSPFGCLLE